jgi:hypothetical protein
MEKIGHEPKSADAASVSRRRQIVNSWRYSRHATGAA